MVARALLYVEEFFGTAEISPIGLARDIWALLLLLQRPYIFRILDVPTFGFLKVDFNGSMADDGRGKGVGFVIRDHEFKLVATGGQRIFDSSVVCVELKAAWEGISYAKRTLGADRIILEGDSATVIDWIRGRGRAGKGRPLLLDIRGLLQEYGAHQATHVYREVNCAADWVTSYATHHSGSFI
uniref:Predicted protein n=1 Tax=Phoenix dactylifera TaxID=42345 RepID=F6LP61_PHODC|nr:predicted protein [Phoenix dactylifera]